MIGIVLQFCKKVSSNMDNKTKNSIISQLRLASLRWKVRNEVLNEAKVYKERKKKDGTPSKKPFVFFKCNSCKKEFKRNEVDIDHIDPVGPYLGSWDHYIARLFCSKSNLQVLCREVCHKRKTHGKKSKRKI